MPLSSFDTGLDIKAPTKSGRANQFETKKQANTAKKKSHKRAVDNGLKTKTTHKNINRGEETLWIGLGYLMRLWRAHSDLTFS